MSRRAASTRRRRRRFAAAMPRCCWAISGGGAIGRGQRGRKGCGGRPAPLRSSRRKVEAACPGMRHGGSSGVWEGRPFLSVRSRDGRATRRVLGATVAVRVFCQKGMYSLLSRYCCWPALPNANAAASHDGCVRHVSLSLPALSCPPVSCGRCLSSPCRR
jgi:hypothetical protein